MEAKDLMIGDWVHINVLGKGINRKVDSIYTEQDKTYITAQNSCGYFFFDENISPIPITGEILEKNGFKKTYESESVSTYNFEEDVVYASVSLNRSNDYVTVSINTSNSMRRISIKKRYMCVHDLQHVIRMFNVEMEIEL